MKNFDLVAFLENAFSNSIEIDGLGRLFFQPLTPEQMDEAASIDDEAKCNLFAAVNGFVVNGELAVEKYGEALVVAGLTHENAPDETISELGNAVLDAYVEPKKETEEPIEINSVDDEEITDDSLLALDESGAYSA